jgi:hypothetical protein
MKKTYLLALVAVVTVGIGSAFLAGGCPFSGGAACQLAAAPSMSATTATPVYRIADSDPMSTMVLKVDGIVNNTSEAKKVKKALMRVEGVRTVNMCTESGNVTVSYSKPAMGCCSAIHTQLQNTGIQYTLVSNNELPACSGGHDHGDGHGEGHGATGATGASNAAPAPAQGSGCTGAQGATQGQRPACCQGSRRNS